MLVEIGYPWNGGIPALCETPDSEKALKGGSGTSVII